MKEKRKEKKLYVAETASLRTVGADDLVAGKLSDAGAGHALAVGDDGGSDLAQHGTQSAVGWII